MMSGWGRTSVSWNGVDGFIGVIGSAWRVDDKIEKETPEKELERKGAVQWVALHDKYFVSVLMPKQGTAAVAKNEGEKIVSAGVRMAASGVASSVASSAVCRPEGIRLAPLVERAAWKR